MTSNPTPNTPDPATGPTPATAFCQNCGRPLTPETVRVVGQAVFCEPCLAARLAGTPTPASPYADPGIPLPAQPANPGTAALLGFIPGVGAMYNGQYAKGLVHLIVFAVLVLFANVNQIFVLFVFGWEAYMAIEAHHTARARRDGTPLPNPFNLNDIGERMGFGKAWPAPVNVGAVVEDASRAATEAFQSRAWPPPPGGPVPPATPAPGTWGAPADIYSQPPYPGQAPYTNPSNPPAEPYTPVEGTTMPPTNPYQAPYPGPETPFAPYASYPPYAPYAGVPYAGMPYDPLAPAAPPAPPRNRFPAGAIWLIALGTIFLLSTAGLFSGIDGGLLVGFGLMGLAVWIFLHRYMSLADSAASDPTVRLFRSLRGSAWVMLTGLLLVLQSANILGFHRTWPLYIILAGVMTLFERTIANRVAAPWSPVPPMPHPSAPAPQTAAAYPTSITPTGGFGTSLREHSPSDPSTETRSDLGGN